MVDIYIYVYIGDNIYLTSQPSARYLRDDVAVVEGTENVSLQRFSPFEFSLNKRNSMM